MTTLAISAYGIELRLGDGVPLAPVAISAATNTTPIVITTAAHGIPINDIAVVTVVGVTGNTAANGTWMVQAVTATTLRLRGSVGNGAYVSGGTAQRTDTFAHIAEITNITDAGLNTTTIDISSHDGNGWGSSIPTFLHGNTMRVDVNLVPADLVHQALNTLMIGRARRRFLLIFPDVLRSSWTFTGFVAADRSQAPVQGALTSSISIEMTDAPLLAAAA